MKKKLLSLALALALCMGLTVPAFAAELKIVQVPVPTVEEYEVTKYSGWGNFHDGLAILYDSVNSSMNPCYIDRTGKVVIPPAGYSRAWDFSDGFAWVEKMVSWSSLTKPARKPPPSMTRLCTLPRVLRR